jgi:hypothetical protein
MTQDSESFYSKSNMPSEQGQPTELTPPREPGGPVAVKPGAKDGSVVYPSMRGSEIFEFPLYGQEQNTTPFMVETGRLQDLPELITRRIEAALTHEGDDEAVKVMAHYSGCVCGGGIVDKRSASEINELTQQFAQSPDKEGFFVEKVIPYLDALRPGKRG